MADAAQYATPAGLAFRGVLNLTNDHSLASAFGDLIDNPREAGAQHVRISVETTARHGEMLRLSDSGPGLKDFEHLKNAYTFGESPEKDGRHNYGLGEKIAGLTAAACITKLCAPDDRTRLVAMFSKEMQASDGFPKDTIRPICRYYRGGRGGETWLLDDATPGAVYNQKLLFEWSPFRDLAELMGALDRYAHAGRTHVLLSRLHNQLTLKRDDAAFDDTRPRPKWPWLTSLREYCAITYPRLAAGGAPPIAIELLGREVVPMDLSPSSTLFARRDSLPVVLEPRGSVAIPQGDGRAATVVDNPTSLRLTVGFAFERDEMGGGRRKERQADFDEGGRLQGTIVVHRGRVMELPVLAPLPRAGGFLDRGRPHGVGALCIVEAPDECRGNKTKTKMDPEQGSFGDQYAQVPALVTKICKALVKAEIAAEAASGAAAASAQPKPAGKQRKKPKAAAAKAASAKSKAASAAAMSEHTEDELDGPEIFEFETHERAEDHNETVGLSVLNGQWVVFESSEKVRVRAGVATLNPGHKGWDTYMELRIDVTAPGKFRIDDGRQCWETTSVSAREVRGARAPQPPPTPPQAANRNCTLSAR